MRDGSGEVASIAGIQYNTKERLAGIKPTNSHKYHGTFIFSPLHGFLKESWLVILHYKFSFFRALQMSAKK